MKARSEAAAAILETIEDLHEIGLVDQDTLHSFRLRCQLPEVAVYDADRIKSLRDKLKISQAVLAVLLNAKVNTIQKWEQGVNKPNSLAQKLLNILDKHGVEALL